MPFDAPKVMIAGLVKIQLPDTDLRLCDGGFVYFNAEKYTSAVDDFGAIESVETSEESIGDDAPSGRLTFLPESTAAAATLSQPEFQGSPMRFWLVEIDEATGTVSDSELIADWLLDTTKLRVSKSHRWLDMEANSVADRLFNINEGNVLSPTFHERVWTGEHGLDNATGVPTTVAWGTKAPPRGSVSVTAGNGASAAWDFMRRLQS